MTTNWALYLKCDNLYGRGKAGCNAPAGEPCTITVNDEHGSHQAPREVAHTGRPLTPEELALRVNSLEQQDPNDTDPRHPYKPLAGVDQCADGLTDPRPVCGRPAGDPIHLEDPLPDTDIRSAMADELTRQGLMPEPGPVWTNGLAPAPFGDKPCPPWCTSGHTSDLNQPYRHEHELLSLAVLDEELVTDVPLRVVLMQAIDDHDNARPALRLEVGHALYQPTAVVLSRSDAARVAAALITGNVMMIQEGS
jgi:hypothetical protein